MADNETIADIIAEMRNDAESDMNTEDGILGQTLYYLADRIEAALKREKAAIEADALEVGGIVEAAHRREISERVTRAVKNTAKIIDEQKRVGDAAKLREALEHLLHGEYRDRCEVTNIAHSALSAPPRNCDCFKTAAESRLLPWQGWRRVCY